MAAAMRGIMLLVLVIAGPGCSTAPVAGFLDFVRPSRVRIDDSPRDNPRDNPRDPEGDLRVPAPPIRSADDLPPPPAPRL
jgi:hypothetical protein